MVFPPIKVSGDIEIDKVVFVEQAVGVGVTIYPHIYPWTDEGSDKEGRYILDPGRADRSSRDSMVFLVVM